MSKTIEDTYKKLSQKEHVLHRPGMYIGDVKRHIEELWIFNGEKMEKRAVNYSPGFMKIFDEVLTNATDHSFRDSTVTTIKVDFDVKTGEISVWNNGRGIPVVEHKEHKMYVPELIFGNFLSGSNYDDTNTRTGAGTNGIGSKASNVFSKKFEVETVDSENKKKFVQTWTDNMSNKTVAKVTTCSTKSYTKITFIPDYPRFHMKDLEKDTILLIQKRVLDCIACTNNTVQVYLNGEHLRGKGLMDYTKYFFEDGKIFHETFTQKTKGVEYIWEWAVAPNPNGFEQVSFVNGNATNQGGKHVDYILYQIVNRLKKMLEEKKKLKDIKPNMIKDRLFLFLRATVANPSFNSQTKEQLTTQSKDFGCSPDVTDGFITKLYKSSITDEIVSLYKIKEQMDLSKATDGSKRSRIFIDKLDDATWAGSNKSHECSLFITEGLSASTFAKWGRNVIGNEQFGVYSLKGKCNSEDTEIPLWNGEIKLAKDIQIGDTLIGDDGNKRTVLTLYKGNGKMYEVSQDRGESYKVNREHILTLCMPEHKIIYWVPSNYTWRTIYWDKETKNIKAKESQVSIKIKCKECDIMINTKCLKRHYTRKHKNVEYVPYKLECKDMNDISVIETRKRLEEFLLNIDDNNIIDICIQDYLNITESFKRKLKGIRGECVNWEYQEVLLDPYVLGLWLGDGCKSGYSYACDGENDPELINYLNEWGKNNDANLNHSRKFTYNFSSIKSFRKYGEAPLKKILSKYNLVKNKHIPKEYLINSKEVRLKVLAGIIDTDGYVALDGTIEISQSTKHKRLVDDIVYLSRSLGFYTYLSNKKTNYTYKESGEKANAYRIKISGDTNIIPTILPRKQSSSTQQYNMRNSTGTIKIREIDNENYVGIGIDGNNRFLINDFTVTHNCLNVRDATVQQLINNEEINSIKQILGLKQNVEYTKETIKNLRYGNLIILTDADQDGSHISSLIINLFHFWWPSLLKLNYVKRMITPIIKVKDGKSIKEFYTQQDLEEFLKQTNNKNLKFSYYKGLGTWEKTECQELFKNGRFTELLKQYYYKDSECDNHIQLAFEKEKIKGEQSWSDKRKDWLSTYNKDLYIPKDQMSISLKDMVNKELIHFSVYDNSRSIPNYIDGLKPSQRKILYYMLKRNISENIKVAQLSGYVSAETSYHHGEVSLQKAIVGMAQNFIGSNNINLLYPSGNFGTRPFGGADASSARYIFTRLERLTKVIFNDKDSELLKYIEDDGQLVEPEYFLPIIPMILVNGCEGIGTGYSTFIPSFSPNQIIDNLIYIIDRKGDVDDSSQLSELVPFYKNFKGDIIKDEKPNSWRVYGKWKRVSDKIVVVTELPVNVINYTTFLQNKIKKDGLIKDYIDESTDENLNISIKIEFSKKQDLDKLIESDEIWKELKLSSSLSTNNMHIFDENLKLNKYDNPNDLLLDFYDFRIEFYEKRRQLIIKKLKREHLIYSNKVRFITEYISGLLDINRKSKDYVINLLKNKDYDTEDNSYEYLYNMPMITLTLEKVDELNNKVKNLLKEIEIYKNKTHLDLWREELLQLKSMIN